jgi:hypothetical protein
VARVDLPTRSFSLKWVPAERDDDEPSLLLVPAPRLTGMDLTALTVAELMHLKQFLDTAIETAKPVCQALDDIAQHDFDHGLGINRRLYRPLSQFLNFGAPKPPPNPTEGQDNAQPEQDRGLPQ